MKEPTARDNIIKAYLLLCETTPCDRVTVSTLSKKAGYNRTTFYTYFKSVEDLLNHLEQEILEIADIFLPHGLEILKTGIPTEEEWALTRQFFKTNAPVLIMLLGPNGDPRFSYNLKKHVRQLFMKLLNLNPNEITPQLDLLLEFIISGHIQVITHCMTKNSALTPLDFWLYVRKCIDTDAFLKIMLSKIDKTQWYVD